MAKVLATHVHVFKEGASEATILEAGSKVPDWAKDQVTNPAAYVDAPKGKTSDSDDDTSSSDYASWKYQRLVAEAKKRELPTSGKAPDLIARLTEDDAAGDGGDENDDPNEDDENQE